MSGPLVVNDWAIYAHPLFLDQLETLIGQVDRLAQKDPAAYARKNAAKRLGAIFRLAFEVIPQDPGRTEYRQGNTLGNEYTNWFRAKFFQQYRLFFRYHAQAGVIIYGWVNDENSKRAYGTPDDAYQVFRRMLDSGHPPSDWDSLMAEARAEDERLARATSRPARG